MIEAAAAFLAWLGASLVVVADGRRGLAAGTALAAAGLAALAWSGAGPLGAGALALGGAAAAARRFANGPAGWAILPPGSTPRLVMCLAAAIVAFWITAGVATGAGVPIRFAVVLVIALAATRVLTSAETAVLLTAAALLALAVGLAALLAAGAADPWPLLAAAVVAAAVPWLPARAPRAA